MPPIGHGRARAAAGAGPGGAGLGRRRAAAGAASRRSPRTSNTTASRWSATSTQCNIPIYPLDMYPQGGADFKEAVEADLARGEVLRPAARADIASRRPRDMPEGYLVAQSDLAAQAGVPILQWRSPDLVLDDVVDPAHRAFLAGEKVEAVGLESFKAKIVELATAPPPRPRRRPPVEGLVIDAPIFINANPDDQPLAEEVFEKARLRQPAAGAVPSRRRRRGGPPGLRAQLARMRVRWC